MGSLLFFYALSFARVYRARTRLEALRTLHPRGALVAFRGTVVSLPLKGGRGYRVEVAVPYRVELHGRGEAPRAGDLIRFKGRVLPVMGFRNPWGMDREAWYNQRGVVFPLYAREWTLLRARVLPFYRQFPLDFASWGVARLKGDLGPEAGAVASSLVLGFRQGMDWETRHLFTSTGLGHLLAVSGFHMGVVFLFFYTIVRLFLKTKALLRPIRDMGELPSRRALVPALFLLFFYLLVTGAPPSALRAFIMIACWVAARFLDRDRSLEGALALAFLLMTLANPLVVLRVGFQLTFAAMLGVVAVLRLVEPLEGWKAALGGYLAMAFVVPFFTLPFLLFHFHRFSLYAPLANILFILPAGLLVVSGLLHLMLAAFSLQGWLVVLERWAVSLFLKGLTLISALPGASLWVTRKEAWLLSSLVVLVLIAVYMVRRGRKWALVLPLLSLSLLYLPQPRGFMVLDLGRGGRALLFQGGETILVDAGIVRGRGAWGSLRDALLGRDTRTLDALVVSRVIPSRASLVPRVLETFRVERLYLPGQAEREDLEATILDMARMRGTEVVRVGRRISVGPFTLVPRGRTRLGVEAMALKEGSRGWFWKGRLLRTWQRGAVEITF